MNFFSFKLCLKNYFSSSSKYKPLNATDIIVTVCTSIEIYGIERSKNKLVIVKYIHNFHKNGFSLFRYFLMMIGAQ